MSLDDELNKYFKSNSFKSKVDHLIKTDKNFANNSISGGTQYLAKKYAEEMKQILRNEVVGIKGSFSGESFLDSIDYKIEFVNGEGWVIDIFFNENDVSRPSLYDSKYPNGAYLPDIYNNGMDAKGTVFGKWHGNDIRSNPYREAHHFIQNAAAEFLKKHPNVIVNYDSRYGE